MQIPRKYYIWLSFGLLLLITFEFFKKQELDWRPTFSSYDKIPYGTEVAYKLAGNGNWKNKIQRSNNTFYEYTSNDSSENTFIYIAKQISFDKESYKRLLTFVEKGNTIFIASNNGINDLWKNFNVAINYKRVTEDSLTLKVGENTRFTYKKINNKSFNEYPYFKWEDSITNIKALGQQNKLINFINIKHGQGNILLHLNPYAFTNYYLIQDKSFDYVNEVFAMLPSKPIVWDDYMNYGHRKPPSEMRVVLSSLPMRMAYYILVVILLLYMALAWRRKQRVIPVINPLKNNSIEFIDTLTNLYLSNKNNSIIAQYLIRNFRIKMNRKYFIHWNKPTLVIKQQLISKSGKSEHEVEKLMQKLNISQEKKSISQTELIELNKTIQEFTKL